MEQGGERAGRVRIAGDEHGRRGSVVDGDARELGPVVAGVGAVAACHYSGQRRGRNGAKGVVTGAKIGLRASSPKGIARKIPYAALVTGWLVPPSTELPLAARLTPTWAPNGAIRCRIAIIAMSRGQTPRPRHDGPLRTGGGLPQVKRRGGCRAGPLGVHAATGDPPGSMLPRKRGRRRSLPLVVRTNRNAGKRGAPKPCSRPLSDTDTPQPPPGSAA